MTWARAVKPAARVVAVNNKIDFFINTPSRTLFIVILVMIAIRATTGPTVSKEFPLCNTYFQFLVVFCPLAGRPRSFQPGIPS
jgi:hypothetical protein